MAQFEEEYPSIESFWRAIILFGRNSASYKFALAKTLLNLIQKDNVFISLEELAIPYSEYITQHLNITDKQGSSTSSKFLDACRQFNQGTISLNKLTEVTVDLGFNNVLDAFHIVNQGEIPIKFFKYQKQGKKKGIVVTDELLKLKESFQYQNLPFETEARWRLVETAWSINISTRLLEINYDREAEFLILNLDKDKRVGITSCRDALNGYQKGKCFYCFANVSVDLASDVLAEVDHFFPHTLMNFYKGVNLDGIWNLVLACQSCNRGANGKFARVPKIKYLERLHKRNSFFIDSHHPLKETLILQTGQSESERRHFLGRQYKQAVNILIHHWEPNYEHEEAF